MSARVIRPRIDLGSWAGPAIGEETKPHGVEVTGRFVAIAWLGLHFEFIAAREIDRLKSPRGRRRNADGIWLAVALLCALPFLPHLIAGLAK